MGCAKAGAQIEDPEVEEFNGQKVEVWARVIWSPKWALTFADIRKKLTGALKISQNSTLVLNGAQISLENVSLSGCLLIRSIPEAEVRFLSSPVASINLQLLSVLEHHGSLITSNTVSS